MNIGQALIFIITTILFMTVGILSLTKPNWVGSEISWTKHKWIYIPKYKQSTNKYYHKQIQFIGLGFVLASIVMVLFTAVYIFDPEILLLFK